MKKPICKLFLTILPYMIEFSWMSIYFHKVFRLDFALAIIDNNFIKKSNGKTKIINLLLKIQHIILHYKNIFIQESCIHFSPI